MDGFAPDSAAGSVTRVRRGVEVVGELRRKRRRQRIAAAAAGVGFAVVATGIFVAGSHGLGAFVAVWGVLVTIAAWGEASPHRTVRRPTARAPRTRSRGPIFSDYPTPDLTPAEFSIAERAARRAAFDAKGSWTMTKRRAYGIYRAQAGDRFLDWPRWRGVYLSEYTKDGPLNPGSTS